MRVFALSCLALLIGSARGNGVRTGSPSGVGAECAETDAAAATAIHERLDQWVRQSNAGDANAREVWAPGLVGWFPSAGIFSDSAAVQVAGVTDPLTRAPRSEYSIKVDDITGSMTFAAVHDLWTERKTFANPRRVVERTIRGSELWRCQPDGRWRIARFVSAPEPWRVVE